MFGSSFKRKFELANMVFFNRLAKNSVSPPVKIIIKFEQIARYSSMKPSISYTNPFTTPE
jgi:hypothetical protein